MSRRFLKAALLAALLSVTCATCASADSHVPQPYQPEEFAGWLHDFWRADAVFVGTFPFALFFTFEVYDTYRYFAIPSASGALNPSYAPWPFGNGAATYSTTETSWLAVSAVSVSFIVVGIDFILGHLNGKPAKN